MRRPFSFKEKGAETLKVSGLHPGDDLLCHRLPVDLARLHMGLLRGDRENDKKTHW